MSFAGYIRERRAGSPTLQPCPAALVSWGCGSGDPLGAGTYRTAPEETCFGKDAISYPGMMWDPTLTPVALLPIPGCPEMLMGPS